MYDYSSIMLIELQRADDGCGYCGLLQYLKEQRVGTATFLPLTTLKVKPIQERLRTQLATNKSAKLVIDLLKFDSRIQKAVLYAVGNTVYCDTLEEAKSLSFGAQRLRSTSPPRHQNSLPSPW